MRLALRRVPFGRQCNAVFSFVALVSFAVNISFLVGAAGSRQRPIFMNQFAVHIPSGSEHADSIASKHGFINLGQVKIEINPRELRLYNLIPLSTYEFKKLLYRVEFVEKKVGLRI